MGASLNAHLPGRRGSLRWRSRRTRRPSTPSELGFETIVYEKTPPRATIRLNRPEVLNAFDFRMLREIARACEDASWDDEIRVVVVTGEGRAFCVGADLRSWEDTLVGRPQEYWKWFGAFKDMHDRLREIGKPTIARINGIAVGGGNELQMACDLAVIVDDAFIRHVGLEHGSVPAGGRHAVAPADGRRPARPGDRPPLRRDPGGPGGRVGARRTAPCRARSSTPSSTAGSRASSRKLPQTTRYAKHQLNVWRDLAWHQTVGHARDWLSLSMLGDEAQGAIRAFLDSRRD